MAAHTGWPQGETPRHTNCLDERGGFETASIALYLYEDVCVLYADLHCLVYPAADGDALNPWLAAGVRSAADP
jgi:hypothetical protein